MSQATPIQPTTLHGTWELVSFVVTSSDGRAPRHPFGRNGRGRIVYAPDGHMSAMLVAEPPGCAQSSTLETAHHLAAAEKADAYDRTLAYSGRWRLDGEHIHHHVDLALVAGVMGKVQTRKARLDGAILELSYTRTSQRGVDHTFTLRWCRPEPRP